MNKYKVGDKVRILEERTNCMNELDHMDKYLGKVMTIISTEESGDYKMLEDNGYWLWNDNMISGLVNYKVELHPDFVEWYGEIKDHWGNGESSKSFAIFAINQMGFNEGLRNSYKEDISSEYPDLRTEMQYNKEKYTRAILDGNWTVPPEPLWIIKLDGVTPPLSHGNSVYLIKKEGEDGECLSVDWSSEAYVKKNSEYHFTKEELEKLDVRLQAFAKPLHHKEESNEG